MEKQTKNGYEGTTLVVGATDLLVRADSDSRIRLCWRFAGRDHVIYIEPIYQGLEAVSAFWVEDNNDPHGGVTLKCFPG